VKLRWLRWRPLGAPTILESQVRARLNDGFFVTEGALRNASRLRETLAGPSDSAANVIVCDEKSYWEFMREAPASASYELLNARMLVLPLYVFVRETIRTSTNATRRVALVVPRELRLPKPDRLRELLEPVLGGARIELVDLGHPALLAEELASEQSQFDAVALFGDEPSTPFEQFLDRYRTAQASTAQARSERLPLLLVERKRRQVHVLQESSSQIEYALLEYPADSFYRFSLTESGHDAESHVTTGLGRRDVTRDLGRASMPFLLTDSRAKVAQGTLPPCCEETLKQAIGDAALLSAQRLPRHGASRDAGVVTRKAYRASRAALEHALLLYAYLASRHPGDRVRSQEETLRGLVLAAHLAVRGQRASARRVQEVVDARFKDGGEALLAKLGMKLDRDVRKSFSCDAVGLAEEARRTLVEEEVTNIGRLKKARERLIRALASDPMPAAHKPGCGLTQVSDYNPYLFLAQIVALQRLLRLAQGVETEAVELRLAAVMPLAVASVESDRSDGRNENSGSEVRR
jgi:hypothetical protein